MARVPDGWLPGAPESAGIYWIIWRHSQTGTRRLHLVAISPPVLRPNGALLLKFAHGEAFAMHPDNLARIERHAAVVPPATPDDIGPVDVSDPGRGP